MCILADPGREEWKQPPGLNGISVAGEGSQKPPISVLYIDDEPALLDSTRNYLERKGNFRVETMSNAPAALERIRNNHYDVIVSDFQMPVMDGIQLLKILRAEENYTPFIIFTGKGHEDVVVDAYNAGADFYIPKGGNPRAMFLDLTHKIAQIVNRRKSEEALYESEERYRKVVEQSHDAIIIYRKGRVVFANDRVPEITGYTKPEIIGGGIQAYLHQDDLEKAMAVLKSVEKGEIHKIPLDVRIRTKTGEIRHLEVALSNLATDGKISILCTARDITDRKIAEEALKKSEEKYRSIFETFDDLYYQTDMNGIITILSPSCKRLTGWTSDELVGTQVLDLYPYPEQRRLLLDHMFENGAVHDYEVVLINKSGDHLNVSVTSHVVKDEEGKPVAIEGALRDITARIRMERAIAESEERFRTLADFLPVMVFEATLTGMLTFGNRMILPVFGINPSSIGSDINIINYIVPEERERALENIRKVLAGIPRTNHEYTLIRKDGTKFPTMISASAIIDEKTGAPKGLRGVIIDLSERQEAERELRERESYLKTIFNSVQTALVIIDPATHTIHDLNPAAVKLIGKPRDELIGTCCHHGICRAKDGECPVTDLHHMVGASDNILIAADGRKVPVIKTILPVTIAGKEYLLENISDITDRKRAEDAMQKAYFELEQKVEERTVELSRMAESLKQEIEERGRVMEALTQSEEKYRTLVEQTNDLVFYLNREGIITYISPNVATILGFSPDEILGTSPGQFMVETEREFYESIRSRVIATPLPVSGIILTLRNRQHESRIFEVNGTPHIDAKKELVGFSGIARDITERKALEDEIAASLKEKEILLKEIHHRVKNNMQVISSLLSLQAKMMKDKKTREVIRESQNRVMSIALVHEKLYQSKSLARISFREYFSKFAENLFDSYNIKSDRIRLEVESEEIVLPISKAIPVSLIINELLTNSLKYAFPGNRAGTIRVIFQQENNRYTLTVRDDGIGLPEHFSLEKTETLGLQLVVSLVGQLGGDVSFSGDHGTEFTITFDADLHAGEENG